MAKELSVLQQQAEAIKTEVNKGANTSSRIGGMFGDMLEYNEEQYEENKSNTGVSSYPKFSEGEVYTVGQVVNYGGKLYEFTTEHPEGSWNSAHVKSTSLKQIQDKKLTELQYVSGIFVNYGYLDTDTNKIVSSKNWQYTDKIALKKSQSITIKVRGYTTPRPVIVKVADRVYSTLIMQDGNDLNIKEYTYKADTDCEIICFSWKYLDKENDGVIALTMQMLYDNYIIKDSINISDKFLFTDMRAVYANPLAENYGKEFDSRIYSASNYVDISKYKGKHVKITVLSQGNLAENEKSNYGCVFYTKEKTPIITGYYENLVSKERKIIEIILRIPENAFFLKTTWILSSDSGNFKCDVINYNEIIYEELTGDELCNYYTIDNDGVIQDSDSYSRTSLYICDGCISMDVTIQRSSEKGNAIAFYDKNSGFIASYPIYDVNNKTDCNLVNISIPSSAYYCGLVYPSYKTRKEDFKCILYSNKKAGKRKYRDVPLFFSKEINQNPHTYWDVNSQELPQDKKDVTTGVIMLPKNYTDDGNPVPIIMYCHGASHYVYYGKWGATDTFLEQKKHWIEKGFAVMDCNGPRDSNKTNITGLGSYSSVEGYYKCWLYVKEHYNVEDKFCLIGGSAGCLNALNLAFWHSNEIKAFIILSGVTNTEIQTPFNTTLLEQFGVSEYDEEKMKGLNPIKRIINLQDREIIPYIPIPIYAIIGSLEESSYNSIWENLNKFISACRNSNQTASITVLDNLDHSDVVSGANNVVDSIVSNYFNRFCRITR